MSTDFYNFFVHDASSGEVIEVISDTLTASRVLKLPNSNSTIATLEDIGAAGGGSVTSVGVTGNSLFNITNSPVTSAGVINIDFDSQSANTFLGVGNSNGIPRFKSLTTSDIPSLPFSKITGTVSSSQLPSIPTSKLTGVLQPSQMAEGTNNSFFGLDDDNNGGRIYWDNATDEIRLRNSNNTGYVDLRVKSLYVEGSSTIIESETLEVADNRIVLNSNALGSPTEDSGIEVERGTSANALLQWDEGNDRFEAGISTRLYRIVRENAGTIQAGNVNGNTVTIRHNLGNQNPELIIKRTDGIPINFTYTTVDDNNCTINISRAGTVTGWTWYAKG